MLRWIIRVSACALALLFTVSPVRAQYGQYGVRNLATGERYHVEARFGVWNPAPDIIVSSESEFGAPGIIGTDIDAVADLGFVKTRFGELHLVLRPATKHKFRFDYMPMKYEAEAVLQRRLVFNGIAYEIGYPVNSMLDWKAYRFGYEYDFLYHDRWFAGFMLDVKYNDARVDLNSPFDKEYARAQAPIPAIGGIVRVYPFANISGTLEVSAFKLPRIDDKYEGKYVDVDAYGTINFINNVGAQIGYRSLVVDYLVKQDKGALRLKGWYFAGVARF